LEIGNLKNLIWLLLARNSISHLPDSFGNFCNLVDLGLESNPSTGHIHILRVPPEMTSAEAAITWVNHGIHPDEFSVQT
jgi:hypothetical protein